MIAVTRRWTGWLRWGIWAGMIVVGFLLLGDVLWASRDLALAFARWLSEAGPWFALWRTTIFLLLIGFWPLWIDLLAQRRNWSADHRVFVTAQRWRIATWLVMIELVLVQGVLFRFIQEMMR